MPELIVIIGRHLNSSLYEPRVGALLPPVTVKNCTLALGMTKQKGVEKGAQTRASRASSAHRGVDMPMDMGKQCDYQSAGLGVALDGGWRTRSLSLPTGI